MLQEKWLTVTAIQQLTVVSYSQAAKLDPQCSETFEYLGHYYHEVAGDLTRAQKCYQKSFDLDNENETAGEKLCDLLKQGGQEVG